MPAAYRPIGPQRVPLNGPQPSQQLNFTPPTVAPPENFDLKNTAQDDPDLRDYLNTVKEHMKAPGWEGEAIDTATSKIRDATEGRRKALRSMMAKRGVLGDTTVPELSEAALS